MILTVISHTEHYKLPDGSIVGWGPTVNELNHLLEVFDTIYHVAVLHSEQAPPSALPYTSKNIKFIALAPAGGTTMQGKFRHVLNAPRVIRLVLKYVTKSDYFQLRTPTGIGVYLIPILTIFSSKQGWFKYAGNWNQNKPPLGYRLQRLMLKHQSRPVTINGTWEHQPKHCLTFENPCLTEGEVKEGQMIASQRQLPKQWNFCYVGRLEDAKGVIRIIEAFIKLSDAVKTRVGAIHLIGDGEKRADYESLAKSSNLKFVFHGFLPRHQVFEIYKQSDVFLMPTQASEGFPKVIAEAMNYGCLPVVSDVSAIGHYIFDGVNGYIIKEGTTKNTSKKLMMLMRQLNFSQYSQMINEGNRVVKLFTYTSYNHKIVDKILQ